ncbi:MAG: UDP-glucose/GDP-mannose dehydrogenase family protein [Acidobacteriia bacterium]|nr:UDP-glucose/GDP-mannose dehydrogenase family protein [Terriglobia bacterium]
MQVAIIGTGYVGLTTGVCLAWLGHEVRCLDTDASKIDCLTRGECPIYEPHLSEMMAEVKTRLNFTTSYAEAIPEADVVFVAVGTPPSPDGSPDLKYLRAAAQSAGKHLGENFTVVVNKSTVPIGSGNWVESLIRESFATHRGIKPDGRFAIASNPEFLREGAALHDTLYADRIVVGADSSRALEVLYTLYRPLLEQSFSTPSYLPRPDGLGAVPMVATDLASAELIKYAANAFLALKISYINEIGQLAEKVGADVTLVAKGIGLDTRIGTRFLQAGLGWGGSCFGKDTAALISTASDYGLGMPIVTAAREVNRRQRERVVEKLLAELKILNGKTIGLLGLAFKPHTDDLRDAPSLEIAKALATRGCKVLAHDPVAMDRARREFPDVDIHYCATGEDVAHEADALILVTDWPQYQTLDWAVMAQQMKAHGNAGTRLRILLDGRNFLDARRMEMTGFRLVRVTG